MDIWDLGNYEIVGDWFGDAARSVLDGGAMPEEFNGLSVLDVACGTGAVSLEAAHRGATVRGVDFSETMLISARRRAHEHGVQVDFSHGSFEDLSAFGTSDVVTSTFGAMFAADPPAVAAQLAAATSEAGVVGVTAWHPDGAFGATVPELAELVGPTPVDVTRWSDPEQLNEFFAATDRTVVHHRRDAVLIPFSSAAEAVALMRTHSGPWVALFGYLESIGNADAAAAAFERSVERHSVATQHGIALRADFTVTHLGRD